jgi:transposase
MDVRKYSTQVERLEVVETGRRRHWSDDEKLRIVLESLETPRAISSTARRHGISRSLLMTWRRTFRSEPMGPEVQPTGFVRAMVATAEAVAAEPDAPVSGRMVIEIGKDRRAHASRPPDWRPARFDVVWQGFNTSFHEADGIIKSAICGDFFLQLRTFLSLARALRSPCVGALSSCRTAGRGPPAQATPSHSYLSSCRCGRWQSRSAHLPRPGSSALQNPKDPFQGGRVNAGIKAMDYMLKPRSVCGRRLRVPRSRGFVD